MTRPPSNAAPSAESSSYRGFWDSVGSDFPDLRGALSTQMYRENEEWLLRSFLSSRPRLLKTDLWDECKNTRILQWAASEGALPFGVDIALPMVRQARAEFPDGALRGVVSDVRRMPFPAESFDAVYSMGTIEHFSDPERALAEMARVLRPGGVAIVGVPNRFDPFLRPVFVDVLFRMGLYDYGYERSFSRAALRRMVEQAGLRPETETGILFIPGWLRMFELFCRHRLPSLTRLAEAMVLPFVWLDRQTVSLRRFGYLIVCVARKP